MPSHRDIDAITKDGFVLPEDPNIQLAGLAFLSLRIALKAFFSSYKAFGLVCDTAVGESNPVRTDCPHPTNYQETYAEVILHFQHFIELILKDILNSEHPLLAINASDNPEILYKLLKKEDVPPIEYESLHFTEFTDALKRITTLITANKLDSRFQFIKDAKKVLEKLNQLRNRLLHRGRFVLRYAALDELIGAYVLPFVINIVSLTEYQNLEQYWKYETLKCKIDPIKLIIDDFAQGKYDVGRIAFLKELGRAAYESPAHDDPIAALLDRDRKRSVEKMAQTEVDRRHASDLRECPVCGVKSLLMYEDWETYEDANGNLIPTDPHPYMVRCICCTFEIDYNLKSPREYGLFDEDYWESNIGKE